MAFYKEKKLQNGKVKYIVQVGVKNRNTGKYKYHNRTWENPEGLVGKRAERAAHAFGEEWEKELKDGRTAQTIFKSGATFSQVADAWLNVKTPVVSMNYVLRSKTVIDRMKNYFGDMRFCDIRNAEVTGFFNNLNTYEYVSVKARLKDCAKSKLDQAVLDYGVRKASSGGDITRPTLFNARKGVPIEWASAKIICHKLGLTTSEIFDKIETASLYAKETILKHQRVLSAIFNNAIKNEWATTNYASRTTFLKGMIAGKERAETHLLSDAEFDNFIAVLDKWNLSVTLPIYFMAMLGLRTCEVCGLDWQDIDFEKQTLSVRQNRLFIPHKGIINAKPKTKGSARKIDVPTVLFKKIKQFKAEYDRRKENDSEFDESGAIYCDINGKPATPSHLNKLLKKFLFDAGCHKVSCHKLRHGFITKLISNGVPPNVVAKIVGHASADITLSVYTHYSQDADNSKEVLEKIFKDKT